MELESSKIIPEDSANEYVALQRRIFKMTLVVTLFATLVGIVFFDLNVAISILLGAFSGIIYFRLLAKSIGSLGKSSSSVSKFQLIVPVVLVLVVAKLPQLDLFASLVGFLLYKPSLIIQFLLEPSSQRTSG